MRIKISEIKMGNRIRRDTGDLTALNDSMRRNGLLQPILIDPDNYLVAGYRRIQSARLLGWESIEARLVDVEGKKERLLIEAEENTTRKDFNPDELARADKLLDRYSRTGFIWRIMAWFMDFFERLFRRGG